MTENDLQLLIVDATEQRIERPKNQRDYNTGKKHAHAIKTEIVTDSKGPKISEKTWKKVFELFNLDLSPEQIASVVKISHESIYRRIYAEIRTIRKN